MPEAIALTQETADAALDGAEVTEPAGQPSPGEATKSGPEASPDAPDAAPAKASAEGDSAQAPTEPAVASEAEPHGEAAPDDYTDFDPFVYRAEGSESSFPGAFADADGRVLFTKQSVPVLRQALASAHALPRIQRELNARNAQTEVRAKAAETSRDTLTAKVLELARSPEAMQQFLDNLAVNVPVLLAEARTKGLEAERAADRQRLSEYEAERLDAQQRPQMEGLIDEALEEWLVGDYAVEDATRQQLRNRFIGQVERIFPRGENGQRQDARATVMRDDLLWFFSGRPTGTGQPRKSDGTFAKLEAAKKENAKRTEPVKTTPTVAAGKAAAPTGGKTPKYKTTKEADDAIW